MTPVPSTIAEWLRQGEAQLRAGPHPDPARRDAELLLLAVLGRDRAALLADRNQLLAPLDADRFRALIARRKLGEPIQYILGQTEFYGLPFEVSPAVLIPRPETERLVEKVIDWAKAESSRIPAPRILDVGTGSGVIAIALARHLPHAAVTAIDISTPALTIAEKNANRNQASIRFLQGDLLVPVAGEIFNIVVSNPPYVPAADRSSLAVEVRDHEPALALFAGPDGLEVYRRLIPAAFGALTPGGLIALEIGYAQSPAIAALLNHAGFRNAEFSPDLQGIPRVACAIKP